VSGVITILRKKQLRTKKSITQIKLPPRNVPCGKSFSVKQLRTKKSLTKLKLPPRNVPCGKSNLVKHLRTKKSITQLKLLPRNVPRNIRQAKVKYTLLSLTTSRSQRKEKNLINIMLDYLAKLTKSSKRSTPESSQRKTES
jgi:hypothetical protein